jgi:hypothetical protein
VGHFDAPGAISWAELHWRRHTWQGAHCAGRAAVLAVHDMQMASCSRSMVCKLLLHRLHAGEQAVHVCPHSPAQAAHFCMHRLLFTCCTALTLQRLLAQAAQQHQH